MLTAKMGAGFTKVSAIGGALTLLMDLAQPLWPMALTATFAFFCLSLLALTGTAFKATRAMSSPLSLFFFVMFLLSLGTWMLQSVVPGGTDKGLLASEISVLSRMQDQVLDIVESNREIARNTAVTAEQTTRIAESNEEIVAVTKRETSDNPKKELSNRGFAWNEQAFWDAVTTDGFEEVRLFQAGGMDFDDNSRMYKMAATSPEMAALLTELYRPLPQEFCHLFHKVRPGMWKFVYDYLDRHRSPKKYLYPLTKSCPEGLFLAHIDEVIEGNVFSEMSEHDLDWVRIQAKKNQELYGEEWLDADYIHEIRDVLRDM